MWFLMSEKANRAVADAVRAIEIVLQNSQVQAKAAVDRADREASQAFEAAVENASPLCEKLGISQEELRAVLRGSHNFIAEPKNTCPSCDADLSAEMLQSPYFVSSGGHPGDSGAAGRTPQDPVSRGTQTCSSCLWEFEVEG